MDDLTAQNRPLIVLVLEAQVVLSVLHRSEGEGGSVLRAPSGKKVDSPRIGRSGPRRGFQTLVDPTVSLQVDADLVSPSGQELAFFDFRPHRCRRRTERCCRRRRHGGFTLYRDRLYRPERFGRFGDCGRTRRRVLAAFLLYAHRDRNPVAPSRFREIRNSRRRRSCFRLGNEQRHFRYDFCGPATFIVLRKREAHGYGRHPRLGQTPAQYQRIRQRRPRPGQGHHNPRCALCRCRLREVVRMPDHCPQARGCGNSRALQPRRNPREDGFLISFSFPSQGIPEFRGYLQTASLSCGRSPDV